MKSPFKVISDVFQPRYRVNFSIKKPDGSILLTLSDDDGVAVKRFMAPDQWQNQEKLQRLISSLSMSLAIERGDSSPKIIAAASRQMSRSATA